VPKLRKALALSASDWLLIVQAIMWFAVVEFGLLLVQLKTLLSILSRGKPFDRENYTQSSMVAERAAYCVELASRLYPLRATCLKKAVALYALLSRKGFDVQLVIGAARQGERLDAHAWLEHQGQIILGAPAPGRYSTLCALENSLGGAHPQERAAS
jgi:hypothetical protein